MIRAIAVDDEILALRIIEKYAESTPNLKLERCFNTVTDAHKYLRKQPVDLLFLDISMPLQNGLQFYEEVRQNSKVIFTTASSEHAVKAFEINAVDYLVKPFSLARFQQAVEKCRLGRNEASHLAIRADYKLHHLQYGDILLIEGMDDYIKIHLSGQRTITARTTMKEICAQLPEEFFVRVHRSYIVPVKNIRTIRGRDLHLGEFIVPVSDTYRKNLEKHISPLL